jgi:hypothetical protein
MSKDADSVLRGGTYLAFRVPEMRNSARFRRPPATAENIFPHGGVASTKFVEFHTRHCDSAAHK